MKERLLAVWSADGKVDQVVETLPIAGAVSPPRWSLLNRAVAKPHRLTA